MLAALVFLRSPWVLLALACVIGAGGTGWYRMKWLDEIHGREVAVAEAQKKADSLANEIIIAQAAAMAVTERTVTVFRDRIANAPQTSSCGPVLRDAIGGVREILRGGDAGAQRGTPPAVR